MLEKRIETFINSSVDICAKYPHNESMVTDEMQKLKSKWNDLLENFEKSRNEIGMEIQYQTLADKVA